MNTTCLFASPAKVAGPWLFQQLRQFGDLTKPLVLGSVAADSRCDPGIQQVACQEDRAFSRDLLKEKVRARLRDCEQGRLRKSMNRSSLNGGSATDLLL